MKGTYRFTGELWRYPGDAAWHFVTLPEEIADEIAARFADGHRAFGSLAVAATVGPVTWTTSLFKDTKLASYLLPIKADVRRRARAEEGDEIEVVLQIDESGLPAPS